MDGKSNMELIPTDDLITEILKRFDHAVFMGIQCRGGENNDIYNIRRWRGNSYTCCGLSESLKRSILNEYEDNEEPIDKEDL